VLVRAGQKALVRGVDQVREFRGQRGVVEAELSHQAGAEVFQHTSHWPISSFAVRGRAACCMSMTTLFLLRLKLRKKPMPRPAGCSSCRLRRLDLDDFGAEVGQDHAAGRAHDHVGELDDADAVERKAGVGGRRHDLWTFRRIAAL
jgi:hypothetical protein